MTLATILRDQLSVLWPRAGDLREATCGRCRLGRRAEPNTSDREPASGDPANIGLVKQPCREANQDRSAAYA